MQRSADIQIPVSHKDLDFVIHVELFDYNAACKATRFSPADPAEVEATHGWVALDGDVSEIVDITEADVALLVELANNNAQLFETLVTLNADKVAEALFKYVQEYDSAAYVDACAERHAWSIEA